MNHNLAVLRCFLVSSLDPSSSLVPAPMGLLPGALRACPVPSSAAWR